MTNQIKGQKFAIESYYVKLQDLRYVLSKWRFAVISPGFGMFLGEKEGRDGSEL